jgi:hypothetical protein
MPLILSGNVASATATTGYTVANSCRFNDGDSAYMEKSSSAGNRRTFTFSAWVKRGVLGGGVSGYNTFFSSDQAVANSFRVTFTEPTTNDDRLIIYHYTGSDQLYFKTNRLFRDVSAWYHIVVAVDTTQATDTNRFKLYVNGTQETSFATETYPSQDLDTSVNQSGAPARVGAGTSLYFDGYMAEVCLIDGTQYAASDFGEFDEDSPTIWKPKDVSGLTFGTNGFYLDFEDSANLGNDANGGTDLTETNLDATDQATDTPTNAFATLNPLYLAAASYTIEEGNLQITANASNAWRSLYGNFGITSGKWYWEIKFDAINAGDVDNLAVGIVDVEQVVQTSSNGKFFGTSRGYAYHAKDGKKLNNDTVTANGADYGDAWTAGDIVGCAVDLDNQKIYWSKNGTFQDSGDPTTGATGTGSAFDIGSGYTYLPVAANYYTAENYSFNFGGCPAFSISSSNADGNGYGNFEYAVPSGYYALCTKNLAEYG